GLRNGAQGLAHVQPARCARRDLGHRACRLHRPRARAVALRCPGVLRVQGKARLPDAGQGSVMAATLLVELLAEELPPKSLKALATAFKDRLASDLLKNQLKLNVP